MLISGGECSRGTCYDVRIARVKLSIAICGS